MGKKRIHEIAKDLDMSSKDVLDTLIAKGLNVKNHMSTIPGDDVERIKAMIQNKLPSSSRIAQEKNAENQQKTKQTENSNEREREKSKNESGVVKNTASSQNTRENKPRNNYNEKRNTQDKKSDTPQKELNSNRLAPKPGFQKTNQFAGKKTAGPTNKDRNLTKTNNDNRKEVGKINSPIAPVSKETVADNRNQKSRDKEKSFKTGYNKFDNKKGGKRGFKSKSFKKNTQPREIIEVKRDVVIEGDSISVQNLAHQLGKKSAEIIKKLMLMGSMVTINQELDIDTVQIIADEYGAKVETKISKEEELLSCEEDDTCENTENRPPVVTIMGHVDHGKTSLLDKIRSANVTAGEAGGITQHIGAYQVEINGQKITFLDTPGHEAFTSMRARGAQITDIAILVVAADDGVMPQTIEAINHARAAKVPIIVAVNKIDRPEANVEKIKQELTEYQLVSEEWGGDTIIAPVSAKTGEGIDNLLEMILLVSEMLELKANYQRKAKGTVVEAKLDKNRGAVATLLVQNGTLKTGDFLIVGVTQGRIRAMFDHKGKPLKMAEPSTPVEILGLDDVPNAGDDFFAVDNEKLAKQVAQQRANEKHQEEINKRNKISLDDLFAQIQQGEVKDLNVILKADVQGSIEAIKGSLEQLSNDEVRVNIIHIAVGGIRETDVMLAAASNAIIIGFNVRPDANSKKIAEKEKVDIRTYKVIYDAVDDIKAALSGLLSPELREKELGQAEVRATFKVPKVGTVAGCYVTEGKVVRAANVRVVRDGIIIHDGHLSSLKRFKEDAKEVATGYECGMGLERFNDLKEGDVLEFYHYEEIKRVL